MRRRTGATGPLADDAVHGTGRAHLAGAGVLRGAAGALPGASAGLGDLVERLEWLAAHAHALPELRTDGPPSPPTSCVAGRRVPGSSPELSLIARVEALEMLGEHERVAAIMERPAGARSVRSPGRRDRGARGHSTMKPSRDARGGLSLSSVGPRRLPLAPASAQMPVAQWRVRRARLCREPRIVHAGGVPGLEGCGLGWQARTTVGTDLAPRPAPGLAGTPRRACRRSTPRGTRCSGSGRCAPSSPRFCPLEAWRATTAVECRLVRARSRRDAAPEKESVRRNRSVSTRQPLATVTQISVVLDRR